MKIVLGHLGALVGGAIVPPTVYMLMFGFQAQAAVLQTPTPNPPAGGTPTATQTPTPTAKPPSPTLTPILTATPTLSPTPTATSATSQQLDSWFTIYSDKYSVDRQTLWSIAVCESGLNVNAKNGDYWGLYQFASGTWRTTRMQMNLDPNPQLRVSPEEAIKTAAFKISVAGVASWPSCNK